MDFRSLSRRELQALCKRNKIPANLTNVAMADALAALPLVEGIEEFLNGEGSGVPESPMKEEFVCSDIPRTALRTSTRRKAVKDDLKSSQPMTRTRRAAAARCTEESENRDFNVALTTPSLPSGQRRTAAVASSACKKVDFQMMVGVEKESDDLVDQVKNVIEKTPAVPKSQKRITATSTRKRTEPRNNGATEPRVYSTRRSVRLLEKNLESLSLADDGKMEPITVHMSFDEMPISKFPEPEPEMDLDSSNLVIAKSCDDDFETEAPDDNLDVKCFSEKEGAYEVSKDDDAVEISAEVINDSDKLSLHSEDVDFEVHTSSIVDESVTEVVEVVKQNESPCELEHIIEEPSEVEAKLMNNSVELSLPHENVKEETQVDDVLNSVEEFFMEVKDDQNEYVYESESTIEEDDVCAKGEEALDADIDGDKKEMETKTVSVQAEDDTIKSMDFPENASKDLVDVKIQWQMEEAPKDVNDVLDSQPKIPNDILQCEEDLVDVSVTSTEEIIPTSSNINGIPSLASFAADQLASQFPRPTVVTKSPFKQPTIRLVMDNSDAEDEDEKVQGKADCVQRQIVEKNDVSLRQLKKMFKEQLQLSKKKMDNNNTKVGGKMRTALQPLPENRMDELEKRF